MPLDKNLLNSELLHWIQNKSNNKVQAATAFMDAYHKYALGATCGGLPVTNIPVLEGAKTTALGILVPGFYGIVMPVWAGATIAAITLYWNTAVTGAVFGPTVTPPVTALPEPTTTAVISAGLTGIAGAKDTVMAKIFTDIFDTWTRTMTAVIAGTPTPFV